jgi:hypothetical protein
MKMNILKDHWRSEKDILMTRTRRQMRRESGEKGERD